MRVLGLCGSLRQRSLSAALLQAFVALASGDVIVDVFDQRGELPLFNPDIEHAPTPAVLALWNAVASTDALIVVSPEYAHGITAVMKNQLDWLVGQVSIVDTPVAVVNPASGSQHADTALREVLHTMSARLVDAACVRMPVIGAGVEVEAIARGEAFADDIHAVLDALSTSVTGA
ncbi:NADPH-dependent FMN reductase [Lysobacter sp. HA35]